MATDLRECVACGFRFPKERREYCPIRRQSVCVGCLEREAAAFRDAKQAAEPVPPTGELPPPRLPDRLGRAIRGITTGATP